MNPHVALFICFLAIAGLFYLDRDESARPSRALWIPVLWLSMVGSRPLTFWLGLPPPESAEYDIQLEGSPYDRAFFLALLVAGIIVLLSMAHGLELRVPYVDEEIVEYFERLPASLKVRNGSRKWLHRRVCQSFLPESILKRPKRGFAGNVVDDWFRRAIDSKMNETLLDRNPRIYQYLRPSVVRELFEQHTSGRQDNHKILFSLVVFGEWLRAHEAPVAPLS